MDYVIERRKLKAELKVANARIAELEAAQQWHDMDDLPPVDDDGHARFEVVVDDYVTIGEYNEYKKIPWHDETGSQISPRLWRNLPPMQGKE
jgi:hypothetical protein